VKQTRQGVQDLGGNYRQRRDPVVVGCTHVWERTTSFDCLSERADRVVVYWRCGLCHATRH
jgi:hypothetical protein